MNIEALKKDYNEKLLARDYYGMFELVDNATNIFLTEKVVDYNLCIELINVNQDLLEHMGFSKQFEMAFELLNKLTKNRNRLFLNCLLESQQELKVIFKRSVGDYSTEY